MGVLTISAIDHTTGQLTITGHGLNTGDGPGALFKRTGGIIPTGLAAVTDYYAIVVNANTIKLADTNAHAMAGTALTFSSDGTLPVSFQTGIPYRRARTYAAGSQIDSKDLNSMMDSHTAVYDLLTGQSENVYGGDITLAGDLRFTASRGRCLHALQGTVHGNWIPVVLSTNFDYALGSTGAGYFTMLVTLDIGDRITSIDFMASGNASANVTATAHFLDASTGDNPIGTLTLTAPSSSWASYTITCTPTTMVGHSAILLVFAASASGIAIGSVTPYRTRPPL